MAGRSLADIYALAGQRTAAPPLAPTQPSMMRIGPQSAGGASPYTLLDRLGIYHPADPGAARINPQVSPAGYAGAANTAATLGIGNIAPATDMAVHNPDAPVATGNVAAVGAQLGGQGDGQIAAPVGSGGAMQKQPMPTQAGDTNQLSSQAIAAIMEYRRQQQIAAGNGVAAARAMADQRGVFSGGQQATPMPSAPPMNFAALYAGGRR